MTTLYNAPLPQMPASNADVAAQEPKPKKVIKHVRLIKIFSFIGLFLLG